MQWSLLDSQTLRMPVANVGNQLDGSDAGLKACATSAAATEVAAYVSRPRPLPPAYRFRYSELFRNSRSTSACVMRLFITLVT